MKAMVRANTPSLLCLVFNEDRRLVGALVLCFQDKFCVCVCQTEANIITIF